ncbi:MAG: hypothetical protein QOI24_1318 [Acidobacteriota bacterium]|jgi:hypothetical protein|nr:hypothetical protein [Acidobacteriota bacterium]
MRQIGFVEEAGLRLRAEPARDACFKVVRRDREMVEYDDSGPQAQRESLHRHMTNEITSLDIAAQCLLEFPDAPWALRMELARQCWDEARHTAALHRRLEELGGHKGEFPISAFEWQVTCALDDLAGRLASQNRTFEAGAMDVVGGNIREWRAIGDDDTAYVLDAILADEIQHVRFANRWIKQLAAENPRVLMKVAMAVRFVSHANQTLQTEIGGTNANGKVFVDPHARIPLVNIEDRKLAEFNDEEINEILKQAGFRSLVNEATA